jgi:hypothetical protein
MTLRLARPLFPRNLEKGRTMSKNINLKEFIVRTITCWVLALSFVRTGVCAPIPEDITKTVVFIYKGAAGTPAQANGTGFIVTVPAPVPGRAWFYVITAKHVVHTNSNDLSSPLFSTLWIRVNEKSGGSSMHGVNLITSGQDQSVFFHSDPSVDIAVMAITPTDVDAIDIKSLPENMLVTADDFKNLNIGVGTDMFFTGMFTSFLGEKRSYPIVRFGKLAMIPDEKINFGPLPAEGYLMEAFSFGGNSGSPVFFYPSADNTPGALTLGPRPIKIAGVMRGFFGDFEPVQLLQTQTGVQAQPGAPIPVSNGNSGIAFVVPARFISEILHLPELESLRQKHP